MQEVIIIGSGPAGLTAAIYAARANLNPLVIEGLDAGGQLMLTTMVENWPGYRDGIMGPDLIAELRLQATRFGSQIITGNVDNVDISSAAIKVQLGETVYESRSLIISTGASARLLGLPSELKLMGHGVSTCATCDGFFFKERPIVVVGGGDSAMEEALFLTKFASHVTVVHRRDILRASKIMQDKALNHPKISFEWSTEISEIRDVEAGKVTSVTLRRIDSGLSKVLPVDGVFVAIGHNPNTSLFAGQLALDEQNYIRTKNGSLTSRPGVFACGDVQDPVYRQAVTAAGSGCMAAIDAERYLESLPTPGNVKPGEE
ncbi:MAG: thioredoxin-disulfide reductase [Acidobacteriota bacterium]|jgi:thioredoxin reductase (NADPH)|nr:thioredoxin-disulfide reductase [Acidobacteriota bacterium]|tara:strand:- start:2757 stop:3707 length:951 start_codon:yes stop_codon:yes gene_type:complete